MTTDELEDAVVRLRAQNMVLRDFIAWLLAREIGASSKPEDVIRLADKFGEIRISALQPESVEDLRISEIFQHEKDWLIAAASNLLKRG